MECSRKVARRKAYAKLLVECRAWCFVDGEAALLCTAKLMVEVSSLLHARDIRAKTVELSMSSLKLVQRHLVMMNACGRADVQRRRACAEHWPVAVVTCASDQCRCLCTFSPVSRLRRLLARVTSRAVHAQTRGLLRAHNELNSICSRAQRQ